MPPDDNGEFGWLRRASAFGVHIFTASGAALALLAMLAAIERDWTLMFVWLGCALIVDAVDGTLARRLHVRAVVPRWSGDVLDLVVDILTYVFVPAYAIAVGGLLPEPVSVIAGLLVVCTGVLYFADTHMKSGDNYFLGFPAVWNVVAFYLFALRPEPWLGFAAVVALCVFTFVPMPFLHPFRVAGGRGISVILLAIWSALAIVTLTYQFAPPLWVTVGLCVIGVYFLGAGLFRGRMGA
jgi:phosphatidylcholine synthase